MGLKTGQVRPLVVCVFRHGDNILVAEGHDSVKREVFYRPLGGTIEFEERSQDALARELREELGAEVNSLRYLGTLENIFTYDGKPGHEIVLVYDGLFAERSMYARAELKGREYDGTTFKVVWKSLAEFRAGAARLYPDGLLALLS